MGIEARHAYRFGYLKSEHWQNLRLNKLAREDARCFFCNKRDLSNDVHHVFYRDNIFETQEGDLRVLCREHHDRLHELMLEVEKDLIKSKNKQGGGFKIFRLASAQVEKEIRKSGARCFSRNGSRVTFNCTEQQVASIRRVNSAGRALANFKSIRALIASSVESGYWSGMPESVRQKTAFIDVSVSLVIDVLKHLALVEDEKNKELIVQEFIKENIDGPENPSVS